MSNIKTPPSLKWLLDKRARLTGDLERFEKSFRQRIAQSHQKVLQAEENLRLAQENVVYEEKMMTRHMSTLKKDIGAIDTALGMHKIQINPQSIPSVHSHYSTRATAYGEMTRLIFECFKMADNQPQSTTAVAVFVALHCAPNLTDDEFYAFKNKVRGRLKALCSGGKIIRLHKVDGTEGIWDLPKEASLPIQSWRSKATLPNA